MQKQLLRGQIWLAKLEMTNSSIQSGGITGIRPMILVGNNLSLLHSPVIHMVPVTSRAKRWMPTHIKLSKETTGLRMDSIALCEQSMLLPRECLVDFVGTCDLGTIDKINYGLMIQFGLTQENKNTLYA